MRRPLALLFGISLVVVAVAAPVAAAEGNKAEEVATSRRALNGHVFTPSTLLISPFSTTDVGNTTAYAVAEATGSLYNLQGEVIGERTYDLAGFANEVRYQKRLADWMALRITGTAVVYSGIDGASALATGATVRYTLGLGLTAGLPLARSVRLAFVFDAGFQPAFDLTIAAGLRRAIETGSFDSEEVFVVGRTIQVRPGLSAAWAPHPMFGLQGEVRYIYTSVEKSSAEDPSGDSVDVVVSADFDFGAISSVPIALTAVFRHQEPTSGDGFSIQNAGGGIFYSARPHLATGLELTSQWWHVRPTLDAQATLAQILVRYYW